ncbi:MAG: hypothetical protein JRJ51_23790, partial [Deltaproteobacteria bacterium]|nr:hypothetical protein [Deltaproteobacteria bacterium]
MRAIICILVLFFAIGMALGSTQPSVAKDSEIEVVEVIEVVEPGEAGGSGSGLFLGIHKHRWMTITGPIIWLAMALA